MTRIGTFGQSQLLLTDVMRHQNRLAEAQQQVSSGRKADDLKGYASQALTLLSTKSLSARTEQYAVDNRELEQKLNVYDLSLRTLEANAHSLRQDVIEAVNLGSGTGLMDKVRNLLDATIGQLNQQLDGKYIYGGSRTDAPPVNIASAADLIALAEPPTAAFDNNQIRATVKVDDQVTMTYGLLADDVGLPLLQSLQRILQYDAGALAGPDGPGTSFGNPLTDAQRDFLIGEVDRLTTTAHGLTAATANNGIRMAELERVQDRQRTELTFVKTFIADIEDVDIAEAVSRLSQDQTALQASYSVLAQLNQLSLLDFL